MVMESNEMPSMTPVPRVIKILGDGCSLAANNVRLMVLPIVLDLLMLFGPRLRIDAFILPLFDKTYGQMLSGVSGNTAAQLEPVLDMVRSYLKSINLFGAFQIFPIGVSTINGFGTAVSPLGEAESIQLTSILQIIPVLILMLILGVILGTVYYGIIALATSETRKKFSFALFGKQLLNTVLFYIVLLILLAVVSIPLSCLTTFSFMISPVIYQIFTIILIAAGCWVLIPLFYIPHGIFVNNNDLAQAVKESIELSSWSGPITVRFILLSIVLSMGLNMIWTIPEQTSWLILISIFGHAYVSTALLAGSFILFKELQQWQRENQAFLTWRKANLRLTKLFKKEPEKK